MAAAEKEPKEAKEPVGPAAGATPQPETPASESPEARPSRLRRMGHWLREKLGASLGGVKWLAGKLRALRPGSKQALPEDFADDGSNEPISANVGAPETPAKPAPVKPGAPADRRAPQAAGARVKEAPAPIEVPRFELNLGHAYAAIVGLAVGLIFAAGMLWKVTSVQNKRLHRANAAIEESNEKIERLTNELAEARRQTLAPVVETPPVKTAAAPVPKENQVTNVDSNCDLSGDRKHMMEELRGCIREFARRNK